MAEHKDEAAVFQDEITALRQHLASTRQSEAEWKRQAAEWQQRYNLLRGRLEAVLRWSGLRRVARFLPTPMRRYLGDRIYGPRGTSQSAGLTLDVSRIDPRRDTVLIVLHEATRTGAPILGYSIASRLRRQYNVVALLLRDGDLVDDFRDCCAAVVGPPDPSAWNPVAAELLTRRLAAAYRISYAIVNSFASSIMLMPLTLARVPTIALVHEFSSTTRHLGEMGQALEWAMETVFSAELTANAAREDYPSLDDRPIRILRQGRPDKLAGARTSSTPADPALVNARRAAREADAFVVLGCGTINYRKGVDVFLSCASAVAALAPKRQVRFVWIGSPSGSSEDHLYQSFLTEQVRRAGLEDTVAFVDELDDLDPAYEAADLFFMSSRLDPLPNVAIEAGVRGIPVICFRGATGFAEILDGDPITREGIVPHLDAGAAAQLIAKLADDKAAYGALSDATKHVAQQAFDMDAYVRCLDEIGRDAAALMEQRQQDFQTIREDPLFDADLSCGPSASAIARDDAIWIFLARAAAFGTGQQAKRNFYYRRPCPGFHPQIYQYDNAASYDTASVNALAHFVRSGKPKGPWSPELITPSRPRQSAEPARGRLRIGVHGHFHYPELAPEFLGRLARSQLRYDLLLSTDSDDKAAALRQATAGFDRGAVTIRTGPNRGRDIGALLTLFADDVIGTYDVLGHFHGKRSLFLNDASIGEAWRSFLWQNLIGDRYPMADIIAARFAADDRLGLVFPSDPHLAGWDLNVEIAAELASAMGMPAPLPPFFDFPVGTMFWARTEALAPLFGLKLTWDDYPAEPAPIDGTVLHAIERLLPLTAQHAGYSVATTHVPGVTW